MSSDLDRELAAIVNQAEYDLAVDRAVIVAVIDAIPTDLLDEPGVRRGPLYDLWRAHRSAWTIEHTALVRHRLAARNAEADR